MNNQRSTHSKSHLRKEYSAIRKAIPTAKATQISHTIIDLFTTHVPYESSKNISLYHPFSHELDVLPLIKQLHQYGCNILLPCIVAKQTPLTFHQWDLQEESLETSSLYDIKQPIASEHNGARIPDVMVLPLLAFDQHGYRLGYGGGFYDRTIDHLYSKGHRPLIVGIGYNSQYAEKLPIEPSDHPLDIMITDKKWFDFR